MGGKSKQKARKSRKGYAAVEISGYVAVQVPGAEESSRWLYLRSHAPGVLFVANLPSRTDASLVRNLVPSAENEPDAIQVQVMPNGANRFARVRMRGGKSEVSAALKTPEDWLSLECLQAVERACPAAQWLDEYWKSRDATAVEKWSAATMELFERREREEEERKAEAAKRDSLPDKDGFVTVRRGVSAQDASGTVSAAAFSTRKMELRAGIKKKRGTSGVQSLAPEGFYRWQRRQGKKQELDELRKRFEEDKRRVAAVRDLKDAE